MLNCVIIMGRLTADPELKTTTSGISVTSFAVAVERAFAKQGEERQADFIDVVAWRSTAEFVTKYFRKGSMIAIQGSLQTRMYEDKNGNKRKAFDVVADNVSFCGSKAESGTSGGSKFDTQAATPAASYQSATADDFTDAFPAEDDLPF